MHARPLKTCPAYLRLATTDELALNGRQKIIQSIGNVIVQHRNNVNVPFLRQRKNGLRPLPLPPLMDPRKITQRLRAKNKSRKPDPIPPIDLTPFQKALAENPYAQALSTKIRTCKITNANLPSFYLTSFDLKTNPVQEEKKQAALVPSSLFVKSTRGNTPKDPAITTPQVYVTQREKLMKTLSARGKSQGTASRLMNDRMQKELGSLAKMGLVEKNKHGYGLPPVWRADMDEFVLGLLREGVMMKLVWFFKNLETGLLMPVKNAEDQRGGIVACGLVMRSAEVSKARRDLVSRFDEVLKKIEVEMTEAHRLIEGIKYRPDVVSDPERSSQLVDISAAVRIDLSKMAEPTCFEVLRIAGDLVPLYYLDELLGSGQLEELRASLVGSLFENEVCLMMRKDRRTTGVLGALLQLKVYLA